MSQASPAPTLEPERPRDAAFRAGVAWNLASTAVLGVSGFALLAVLGNLHGPAGFGVFSLVWAPYVIFGQLAVGGLDRSVLRALAERERSRPERGPLVWGAVLPALAFSALFALAFYGVRHAIADWYDEAAPEQVAAAVAAAAPGLFFFGANKVLLGVVNGLRRMRAFAVYQSLRYVLMPVGALVAHAIGLPAYEASFLFTFAEGILFVILAVELFSQVPLPDARWPAHVRAHVGYGVRSLGSGVLMEINSRVDVWMLGRYVPPAVIGVYGTALQMAEGVFQILIALQNNFNPVMARHLAAGERAELEGIVRRAGRRTFLWGALATAAVLALFPLAIAILFRTEGFEASWAPFAFLMAGIWLSSARMPFFNLLLMSGHPAWHSLFMLSVVAVNVVLNALLIPPYGMLGAAAATACSFVASVQFLRLAARRLVGLRI
jgi:O-antigen/teichoic acid export membrane protein